MKFIVYDAAGSILRTGQCPEDHLALQARASESAIEDVWGDTDDTKHRIVNGERVEFTPVERVPTYTELRAKAYPSELDYMDAKVKQASTDEALRAVGVAQEQTYLTACLTVKAKYPKPIN
jgi:hypothetical protein